MKKAYIIHGAYGNPDENWIPWIKNELEKQCYSVTVPQFPTPENQNYDAWMSIMRTYISDFDDIHETIAEREYDFELIRSHAHRFFCIKEILYTS